MPGYGPRLEAAKERLRSDLHGGADESTALGQDTTDAPQTHQIERAVDRTRTSHAGQPFAAVHQALVEALQDEGAQRVVPQVVEELARQISDQATEPWGAAG
jgi:hypothetical protein